MQLVFPYSQYGKLQDPVVGFWGFVQSYVSGTIQRCDADIYLYIRLSLLSAHANCCAPLHIPTSNVSPGNVPCHWENIKSGTACPENVPVLLLSAQLCFPQYVPCCWVNSISGTESKCPTPGATHLRKQTKNATVPPFIWHIFTGDPIGHSLCIKVLNSQKCSLKCF